MNIHPGLTPHALVERARGLTANVAARAADAEALHRLPDVTVREFEAADLCRIWIPRRFGGLEMDLHTGIRTMQEIGRGCVSSAWCLTVWQQHSWVAALFSEEAQQETLGAEPDFHVAAVLAPRGKAKRVAGGYRISGVWPFGSGCDHGTWVMLGALLVDEDGREIPTGREVYGVPAANVRLCLVPRADVAILGDWDTAGLAATGSHSIRAQDVFVPEHRVLFVADAVDGRAPGQQINRAPLYRSAYYSFLACALAGPATGAAQGALDALLSGVDKRMVLPMGLIQSSMVRTHRQVAEIDNKVRTAKLLLRDVADRITEAAEIDRALTVVERAQCRLDIATSVHLSYEAVEQAFLATGGSAISVKNPLQRFMRDMHAVKSHYFMDLETARELSGKVMLGQKPFTYLF